MKTTTFLILFFLGLGQFANATTPLPPYYCTQLGGTIENMPPECRGGNYNPGYNPMAQKKQVARKLKTIYAGDRSFGACMQQLQYPDALNQVKAYKQTLKCALNAENQPTSPTGPCLCYHYESVQQCEQRCARNRAPNCIDPRAAYFAPCPEGQQMSYERGRCPAPHEYERITCVDIQPRCMLPEGCDDQEPCVCLHHETNQQCVQRCSLE